MEIDISKSEVKGHYWDISSHRVIIARKRGVTSPLSNLVIDTGTSTPTVGLEQDEQRDGGGLGPPKSLPAAVFILSLSCCISGNWIEFVYFSLE